MNTSVQMSFMRESVIHKNAKSFFSMKRKCVCNTDELMTKGDNKEDKEKDKKLQIQIGGVY